MEMQKFEVEYSIYGKRFTFEIEAENEFDAEVAILETFTIVDITPINEDPNPKT